MPKVQEFLKVATNHINGFPKVHHEFSYDFWKLLAMGTRDKQINDCTSSFQKNQQKLESVYIRVGEFLYIFPGTKK